MRNTIKAKIGYVIWFKKSKPNKVIVCDGDDVLFRGERRSWEDYFVDHDSMLIEVLKCNF